MNAFNKIHSEDKFFKFAKLQSTLNRLNALKNTKIMLKFNNMKLFSNAVNARLRKTLKKSVAYSNEYIGLN